MSNRSMTSRNPSWNILKQHQNDITSGFSTPCYVYNDGIIRQRVQLLQSHFAERFTLNYAIKANPNHSLLEIYNELIGWFDASSIGEVHRAIKAGVKAENISFTGPAKKETEIESAIKHGIGALIIESLREAELAAEICRKRDQQQTVLIRINPQKTPKSFTAKMTGKASQFGIDEDQLESTIQSIAKLPELRLDGFHIYSGSNCLSAEDIADNFRIMLDTFERASTLADISPKRLIFGAGFGVPYYTRDNDLDIQTTADLINPMIDEFKSSPQFRETHCSIELGRWLIAPCGLLLSTVVSAKDTNDCSIRLCDAGFNNHLAACGLMGTVIRRNWDIENLSNNNGETKKYTLVGPLCTSIDLIASDITLPETNTGDILAIHNSGAYGYTASPINFISHPTPAEILIKNSALVDISMQL